MSARGRLSIRRFCTMFWAENSEWERTGPQTARVYDTLTVDAPADARASLWGNVASFYDRTGNNKIADVRLHDISFVDPLVVCLGGTWYSMHWAQLVYREGNGGWCVVYDCQKNTREARAANALMIALRLDSGIPAPTARGLGEILQQEMEFRALASENANDEASV